ncbi:MAG: M56 family metallopeptidase [Tissierellia bacterium]|nr:M56 family metallopeptidase [Tissierellia bacterium]
MTDLFYKIVDLSLDASYIIILVLLVRLLLKKAPKKYSLLLWIPVFVKLLVPFSFESNLSFIAAKDKIISHSPLTLEVSREERLYTPSYNIKQSEFRGNLHKDNVDFEHKQIETPAAKQIDLLPYIWISGLGFLIFYTGLDTLRFKSKLKNSRQLTNNIYINETIKTAFVFGLIKAKIYLPQGLSEDEKRYILKHEKIHIRRLDHISKFLAFAISSVHWFNPLVWPAYYLMGLDMELSCDEEVLKELGSQIKADYSKSLLSFSSGKRILSASPIAFGESNTKSRIKNILSYKKPKFWISVLAICILALTLVACFAKSPEGEKETPAEAEVENLEEESSKFKPHNLPDKDLRIDEGVINAAISYIQNKIDYLSEHGHKIVDYKIEFYEKHNEFNHIRENPLELWEISYSLKFKDSENFLKSADAEDLGGGWVGNIEMGPFLLFEIVDGEYRPLGNVAATDDAGYLYGNKMRQEMAIREFLDRIGNILVSYNSEHKIVSFNDSSGTRIKLLLSKPIRDDEKGIWIVERFLDTYGNLYLWPYNNEAELESYEYFKDLQEKADKGEESWRLDPIDAAFDYIENVLMDTTVRKSQVLLEEESDLEYFYEIPESEYLGYYMEMSLDNKSSSPDISPHIDIDKVELVDDRERFEEIGEKSNTFEKFGYHIYNPATYPNTIFLTENTKFYISDWANSQYDGTDKMKEVSAEEFAFYAKLQSGKFLVYVKSVNGEALEVGEIVLP